MLYTFKFTYDNGEIITSVKEPDIRMAWSYACGNAVATTDMGELQAITLMSAENMVCR